MASNHRPASSGSDDPRSDVMDDRKRKRMQSNRESARRSRMKKQKQLEDLTNEASQLQIANSHLVQNIKEKEDAYNEMESKNTVLRAQTKELLERLRFLNSMLEFAEGLSGIPVEIPEIPDPLMKPWQLPYPIQPITASDFILH